MTEQNSLITTTDRARSIESAMDYGRFRFRAEVDRIGIGIETTRTTNFQTVKRHGGFSWVDSISPNDGGGTTRFICWMQDPGSFAAFKRFIDRSLDRMHDEGISLARAPTVSAIEVSFDAYSKASSHDELAAFVGRFYKFQTRPVSTNHRLYRDFKGSGRAIPESTESFNRHISTGWQIGIGNRDANCFQHMYLKTTDGGQALATSKHRARTEITLRGEALPATSLQAWSAFRFESLTDWFRFRLPKDDLEPLDELIAERTKHIGERKTRKRKGGGTRLHSTATRADVALNDRAKGALRRLSDRWADPARRAEIRDEITEQSLINTGEDEGTLNYNYNYPSWHLPTHHHHRYPILTPLDYNLDPYTCYLSYPILFVFTYLINDDRHYRLQRPACPSPSRTSFVPSMISRKDLSRVLEGMDRYKV